MRGLRVLGLITFTCMWAPTPALAADSAGPGGPVGPVPAAKPLHLVLPLVANQAELARFAVAVTSPGSPHYAQYESIAELARRFGAAPRTRNSVVRYLRAVGATEVEADATGLFVDATINAGLAARLFAAGLPAALRGSVTGVIGLDTRPLLLPSRRRRDLGEPSVKASSGPG